MLVFLGIWGFPKIVVPQYGWFTRENPIKMDDLEVPPCKETSISPVLQPNLHLTPIISSPCLSGRLEAMDAGPDRRPTPGTAPFRPGRSDSKGGWKGLEVSRVAWMM